MSGPPRTIRHIDAFTTTPLEGNPAAVVDGDGLDARRMQRIAQNQRLSETVFLLPPETPAHHARLRIFTPARELPFAGHPTIAAAHALISERRVAVASPLLLETGAGVVPVAVDGAPARYTMTQPRPEFRPWDVPLDDVASWVGLPVGAVLHAEEVSTGLFWKLAHVRSLDDMAAATPDLAALARVPHGVAYFCIGAHTAGADVHVRAFAPDAGVPEDPVTGSANGCIGALIARRQLLPAADGEITYIAEQGLEMGQPGTVFVRVSGLPAAPVVHVGGHAVTVLRGELLL